MSEQTYRDRKCPVCGKKFCVLYPDEWVYKRGGRDCGVFLCSWTCMRKHDANKKPAWVRRDRIIQALQDGLNPKEIAMMLDEDLSKVWYWKKKLEKEKENEREAESESSG